MGSTLAVIVSVDTGSSMCFGLVGENCFFAFDEDYFSIAELKRKQAVEFLLLQFLDELRDVVGVDDHAAIAFFRGVRMTATVRVG